MGYLGILTGMLLLISFVFFSKKPTPPPKPTAPIHPPMLQALRPTLEKNLFPTTLEEKSKHYHIHYTLDPFLQEDLEKLLRSYRPDYAAIIALEPGTGRILASVDFSKYPLEKSLTLRASFPAASLFKLITASIAIELKKANADSEYPFRGSYHTLYRRNVTSRTPSSLKVSLKEAFAKSINSIFGKIGYYDLSQAELQTYSERFLFNADISKEIPVEKGLLLFDQKDPWELAEIASGFNHKVLLSPLQAALIASSIPNNGVIYEPHLLEGIYLGDHSIYTPTPRVLSAPISAATVVELKKLMRETITRGTSRGSFRDLMRSPFYQQMEMGGKTGSLTGKLPKGKYDWFIGYAQHETKSIAFSCLMINEDFWKVKSSFVARRLIEKYFENEKREFDFNRKKKKNGS